MSHLEFEDLNGVNTFSFDLKYLAYLYLHFNKTKEW